MTERRMADRRRYIEIDSIEEVRERVRKAAAFFGESIGEAELDRRVANVMAVDVKCVAEMKAQMRSMLSTPDDEEVRDDKMSKM